MIAALWPQVHANRFRVRRGFVHAVPVEGERPGHLLHCHRRWARGAARSPRANGGGRARPPPTPTDSEARSFGASHPDLPGLSCRPLARPSATCTLRSLDPAQPSLSDLLRTRPAFPISLIPGSSAPGLRPQVSSRAAPGSCMRAHALGYRPRLPLPRPVYHGTLSSSSNANARAPRPGQR